MMPIFFHAESHLWIAYLLFFNGALLSLLLRSTCAAGRALLPNLESFAVSAFFISLALNGSVLVLLQWLNTPFEAAVWILAAISLILTPLVWVTGPRKKGLLELDWHWSRLVLYTLVFCVLFINGGLIEQVMDAWWHMSLANKIGLESTFSPSLGHLTGLPTRYYPPLWHGNLALIQLASGELLPVIWNSFTAWGSVLKVMAFFLMARALTGSDRVGVLSALLFVMIPGIGNSYLRVSAWPSHIAYTAWFAMFALAFTWLDRLPEASEKRQYHWQALLKMVFHRDSFSRLIAILFLAALIYFVHKAELLYFALGLYFYVLALVLTDAWRGRSSSSIEPGQPFLLVYGLLFTALTLYLTIELFLSSKSTLSQDQKLAYAFPVAWLLFIAFLFWLKDQLPKTLIRSLILVSVVSVAFLIDGQHLLSLFNPELAYPRSGTHEMALIAYGYFGGELKLPGWHLQLRQGLIYSGIVSIPCSVGLAILRPTRGTLFLAANGVIVIVILSSPYLYSWFYDVLDYHSPWRIAILIWHPISIALVIAYLKELSERKP